MLPNSALIVLLIEPLIEHSPLGSVSHSSRQLAKLVESTEDVLYVCVCVCVCVCVSRKLAMLWECTKDALGSIKALFTRLY
jgi:hypothetical protein